MKRFVYNLCYGQTDKVTYLIHAKNKADANEKAEALKGTCHASSCYFVCEIEREYNG